jgi:hypothetical protein
MEPANLDPRPFPDDALEASLRAADGPPLADNGFSTRVVAALPARAGAPRGRVLIPAAGALAGLVWVLARGASVPTLGATLQDITAGIAASDLLLPLAAGLAVIAWIYDAEESLTE